MEYNIEYMSSLFNKTFFKFTAGFLGILFLGFVGLILINIYGGTALSGAQATPISETPTP
ncbi:MAG: hypothetical protein A2675_03880 [Candidatus Yonathbacteria bacterium RIFCSPHIGHO2_01_FULL_51_10]|uniref:Uncharacterized protein n=1 Tax=Candidatus Yonathbacteria bacterium RIFCSPHIGHO2_01_FULL_51_10 TaxID=1802723 RepID=A0A1G2S8C3_9BACT|nr:MAG: hypothetical protein A2675_03880 [Candidatus Yonathbacteria bacterium RIFCSPHIGHO2_01_FULL_51_10]